jgi:hypothetical protein
MALFSFLGAQPFGSMGLTSQSQQQIQTPSPSQQQLSQQQQHHPDQQQHHNEGISEVEDRTFVPKTNHNSSNIENQIKTKFGQGKEKEEVIMFKGLFVQLLDKFLLAIFSILFSNYCHFTLIYLTTFEGGVGDIFNSTPTT